MGNYSDKKEHYQLSKLKEIIENHAEIDDEGDEYITFIPFNNNGSNYTFDFNPDDDLFKQFHEYAASRDFNEILEEIHDTEASYSRDVDMSYCEQEALGVIRTINTIDLEFQKLKN